MFVAVDHHRFDRRIRQTESILAPVLTEEHRLYIRMRNVSLLNPSQAPACRPQCARCQPACHPACCPTTRGMTRWPTSGRLWTWWKHASCVTTVPQHQTLTVQICVPLAGRVASYATSRLLQRNTRRTSCVSAQSTSLGAQCCRQTDTSIFSIWPRHTNAARLTLPAVSGTHRFRVSCTHLPMPARPGATVSCRLHPERRRF